MDKAAGVLYSPHSTNPHLKTFYQRGNKVYQELKMGLFILIQPNSILGQENVHICTPTL